MFRSTQGAESDSTGWISITDTYLLFIALLLTLAMAIATTSRQHEIDKSAATTELIEANSTVSRLTSRTRVLEEKITRLEEAKRRAEEARIRAESVIAGIEGRSGKEILRTIDEQHDRIKQLEKSLTEAQNSLNETKAALESQALKLDRTVARLAKAEADLEEARMLYAALKAAAADTESMIRRVQQMEIDLARLAGENDRLQSIAERAEQLTLENESLRLEQVSLKERIAAFEASNIKGLKEQVAALELAAKRSSEAQRQQAEEQGRIRSQLLGLEGSLGNVVFLLDRSQTMGESGRWDEAVQTVRKWIEHLPIENAAVVMFSGNSLESIPARGYATRVGDELTEMTSQLDGVSTGGNTNTYEAIEAAFRYDDLDTIILFTDGQPDGRYGPNEVLDLVESERERRLAEHGLDIKLHVVGVGDYFDQPMKRFLLGLREAGDGKFIGQ